MPQLKELLVEELQGLMDAETQLTTALPKLAKASHHPKLQEAFQKHLTQTEGHLERLREVFELLGEQAGAKKCRAMAGLIEEGQEIIQKAQEKEDLAADLALIAAAQKVEHYEISAYGTARSLSRLIGEKEVAHLLSRTLGEEEAADFLLTTVAKPLLQQASTEDYQETKQEGRAGRTKAHAAHRS